MAAALVVASGVLIEVLNWEKSIFHMLTDFVIFAASIFYVLAVVGVLVLRAQAPGVAEILPHPGLPRDSAALRRLLHLVLGAGLSGEDLRIQCRPTDDRLWFACLLWMAILDVATEFVGTSELRNVGTSHLARKDINRRRCKSKTLFV